MQVELDPAAVWAHALVVEVALLDSHGKQLTGLDLQQQGNQTMEQFKALTSHDTCAGDTHAGDTTPPPAHTLLPVTAHARGDLAISADPARPAHLAAKRPAHMVCTC